MSMSPLTVTAPQLRPPHRYIAIEGPIGVGKTTLARLLAERWSMRTLFERPQENVFLERFYRDNTRYALPSQLQFALQRAQQTQEIASGAAGCTGTSRAKRRRAADHRFHHRKNGAVRTPDAPRRRIRVVPGGRQALRYPRARARSGRVFAGESRGIVRAHSKACAADGTANSRRLPACPLRRLQ